MRKTLILLLLLIPNIGLAASICALVFEHNELMELSKFEREMPPEFRAEWGYAKDVLESKNIPYTIEKTQDGPVIVFSPTGTQSVNVMAKRLREKYGAKLIYEIGLDHAQFRREFAKDNSVSNLYVNIPIGYVDLPVGLARIYAMLHEVRHLVGFMQAYLGLDSPYYGYLVTKDGSALPTRPSSGEQSSGIWGFLSRLKKKPNPERQHIENVYKEVSIDELRTYISTVYQQALRLSTRLKMPDVTAIEVKERMGQLLTDMQTIEFISNKIEYNLEHVTTTLKDIAHVVISPTRLNDRTIYTANVPYLIEGKEAFYQVQLPKLQKPDSLRESYEATERQLQWSLSVASEVLSAVRPLISSKDPASYTPQEARDYVDRVLHATNPTIRRSWERAP